MAGLAALVLLAAIPEPPAAMAVLNSPNASIPRTVETALRRSIPAFNQDVFTIQVSLHRGQRRVCAAPGEMLEGLCVHNGDITSSRGKLATARRQARQQSTNMSGLSGINHALQIMTCLQALLPAIGIHSHKHSPALCMPMSTPAGDRVIELP